MVTSNDFCSPKILFVYEAIIGLPCYPNSLCFHRSRQNSLHRIIRTSGFNWNEYTCCCCLPWNHGIWVVGEILSYGNRLRTAGSSLICRNHFFGKTCPSDCYQIGTVLYPYWYYFCLLYYYRRAIGNLASDWRSRTTRRRIPSSDWSTSIDTTIDRSIDLRIGFLSWLRHHWGPAPACSCSPLRPEKKIVIFGFFRPKSRIRGS